MSEQEKFDFLWAEDRKKAVAGGFAAEEEELRREIPARKRDVSIIERKADTASASDRMWLAAQTGLIPQLETRLKFLEQARMTVPPAPTSEPTAQDGFDKYWAAKKEEPSIRGSKNLKMQSLRDEIRARKSSVEAISDGGISINPKTKAWLESQSIIIPKLEEELSALDQEFEQMIAASDLERERKIEENKQRQGDRAAAFAARVTAEVAQDKKKAEDDERREAAAARARERNAAEWARANCGTAPANITGIVLGHLKSIAHNPASVSLAGCAKPQFTTKCWAVECSYRANNRIGALNLYTTTFYIGNGTITTGKTK